MIYLTRELSTLSFGGHTKETVSCTVTRRIKKGRAKLSPNRREIEVNSPYRFKRKN